MWACNCLNIVINTATSDFQKVNPDILDLNEDERQHNFFKQDIQQVTKIININNVISGLVCSYNVGSWTIFHCRNCNVYSYAVNYEKGDSCIIINSKLLTSESIVKLRNSDSFSPIFNIIIDPQNIDLNVELNETYLPNGTESTVKTIREVMNEMLRKESLAVEERITKYKEEQFDQLNKLREKAFQEQQALIKVILNSVDKTQIPDSTNKKLTLSDPTSEPSRLNQPLLSNSLANSITSPIKGNTMHSPKRQKNNTNTTSHMNSFDSEGLFEFDGIDDVNSTVIQSDFEESESDIEIKDDESISMRTRTASVSLAKSLPMNIPAFMSQNHSREEMEDDIPQESQLDIAASIKALAKSVHGDAVFGDLPRPRFSTQI